MGNMYTHYTVKYTYMDLSCNIVIYRIVHKFIYRCLKDDVQWILKYLWIEKYVNTGVVQNILANLYKMEKSFSFLLYFIFLFIKPATVCNNNLWANWDYVSVPKIFSLFGFIFCVGKSFLYYYYIIHIPT